MQVIREAAEANGAVFVSFFDVFDGPEHDEDPREKGWMQDDGWHANDTGGAVAAEALAAGEFEAREPPGGGTLSRLTGTSPRHTAISFQGISRNPVPSRSGSALRVLRWVIRVGDLL